MHKKGFLLRNLIEKANVAGILKLQITDRSILKVWKYPLKMAIY